MIQPIDHQSFVEGQMQSDKLGYDASVPYGITIGSTELSGLDDGTVLFIRAMGKPVLNVVIA